VIERELIASPGALHRFPDQRPDAASRCHSNDVNCDNKEGERQAHAEPKEIYTDNFHVLGRKYQCDYGQQTYNRQV
jgi:hypothetical protein